MFAEIVGRRGLIGRGHGVKGGAQDVRHFTGFVGLATPDFKSDWESRARRSGTPARTLGGRAGAHTSPHAPLRERGSRPIGPDDS